MPRAQTLTKDKPGPGSSTTATMCGCACDDAAGDKSEECACGSEGSGQNDEAFVSSSMRPQ
ncbi:uncharacterized protein G2W53_042616 [Senna tora]|uniref:Uncharacterized protein n=1 Tax=Senna tora TaxID=362788 RepID=A0A834SJ56_9FABA|nr:uncharacterized protein G2W53_042616 [Senna tora]